MDNQKIMESFLQLAFDSSSILTGDYFKEEKYHLLLEMMCKTLEFDYGELWILNEDGDQLIKSHISTVLDPSLIEFANYSHTISFAFNHGLPGITWAKKAPIWVDNVQLEPSFIRQEKAKEFSIITGVTMPIFIYDYLAAVFFIFSKKQKKQHPMFLPLLNNISNNLGYSLMQHNLQQELANANEQIESLKDINLKTIDRIFSLKDPYTITHQKMVGEFALKIAKELDLDSKTVKQIHIASLLHDLGKIAIPQEILSKPTMLNKEEYELVKRHPETGYNVIVHFPFDDDIKRMILEHHERLDGSGYPYKKTKKDLLFGSQIIAVADMVEAMMSHRPYRPALSTDQVIAELKIESNVKLDKTICDVAISLLQKNQKIDL